MGRFGAAEDVLEKEPSEKPGMDIEGRASDKDATWFFRRGYSNTAWYFFSTNCPMKDYLCRILGEYGVL